MEKEHQLTGEVLAAHGWFPEIEQLAVNVDQQQAVTRRVVVSLYLDSVAPCRADESLLHHHRRDSRRAGGTPCGVRI